MHSSGGELQRCPRLLLLLKSFSGICSVPRDQVALLITRRRSTILHAAASQMPEERRIYGAGCHDVLADQEGVDSRDDPVT